MLIITDEDVPESVARFLAKRGHDVQSVRDVFMRGTEDPVVAAGVSSRNGLLVTWNRRHFKDLAKRRNSRGKLRYPGMSVLTFNCHHTEGLSRLKEVIDEVESSYEIRVQKKGVRLIVDIGRQVVRIED